MPAQSFSGEIEDWTLTRAFTLIEILIVIAILGVLAVVTLVAINPAEKQAQARDAGRISTIVQLGRALATYYTSQSAYPDGATWADDLLNVGELASFPSGIAYSAGSVVNCTTFVQPAENPTYCYDLDTVGDNGAIVFSAAESTRYISKCTAPDTAYFVFSTSDARGGTICSNGEPSPWASGGQTYEN